MSSRQAFPVSMRTGDGVNRSKPDGFLVLHAFIANLNEISPDCTVLTRSRPPFVGISEQFEVF